MGGTVRTRCSLRPPPGTGSRWRFPSPARAVGLLERLIEDGCQEAIDTGTECLTESLLEGIALNLSSEPGRDPNAGEIPDVPAAQAAATARRAAKRSAPRRRGRNTVFDDQGPAAEAGA
ncbi:hypothetical protein SVIO_109370 [Streptomyces violaceusniger]|uniref:Uncharacterized protein n=1 Tax=Streptomyces violaceusniger TaxID=68280 RepID=A0A4D4LIM7_STRVO|nr:hypothetical protein SVIO_109370 [Streptomyces violaceusniger]